jgi:hypothetical protein
VEAVTVRELVDQMMKMNVPDACQCWKVFDMECMANVSHLSEEQRRTKRVLELQRVVVSCSRPIFGIMQEADKERKAQGKIGNTGKLSKHGEHANKVRVHFQHTRSQHTD